MDIMSKKLDELVNDQDRFETTFLKFRESTDAELRSILEKLDDVLQYLSDSSVHRGCANGFRKQVYFIFLFLFLVY